MQCTNIKTKSIQLTPKLLSLDDIVKERGSTVTEKANNRVKVFFPSDTIKRNARAQSNYYGSSVERSCGGIVGAEICHKREKCVFNGERVSIELTNLTTLL